MAVSLTSRFWTGPLLVAAALAVAGCNGTTYGTGQSPGVQTLKDFAGLAALGGEDEEPIAYSSRAPIVEPPTAGALPPPGSTAKVGSTDWPEDPDERDALIREQIAARANQAGSSGQTAYNPNFRLPPGTKPPPGAVRADISAAEAARGSREEDERARQAFAQARSDTSFDEDGNPVRRYLTDPPSEYRIGDPDAPIEVTKDCPEESAFRWPWQKKEPGC